MCIRKKSIRLVRLKINSYGFSCQVGNVVDKTHMIWSDKSKGNPLKIIIGKLFWIVFVTVHFYLPGLY